MQWRSRQLRAILRVPELYRLREIGEYRAEHGFPDRIDRWPEIIWPEHFHLSGGKVPVFCVCLQHTYNPLAR